MKFWSFEYRNLQTPFHWTERDTCAVNSPSVNGASARSPFSKVCCVVAADYCCLSSVILHIYSFRWFFHLISISCSFWWILNFSNNFQLRNRVITLLSLSLILFLLLLNRVHLIIREKFLIFWWLDLCGWLISLPIYIHLIFDVSWWLLRCVESLWLYTLIKLCFKPTLHRGNSLGCESLLFFDFNFFLRFLFLA